MRSSSLPFLLPTLGALLAVVACGPTNDHTQIGVAAPSDFSIAMNSCKSSLSESRARATGSDMKKLTVKTCQAGVGAGGVQTLGLADSPVNYKISKGDWRPLFMKTKPTATPNPNSDNQDEPAPATALDSTNANGVDASATISLSIGIDLDGALSKDEQSAFIDRFKEECLKPTQAIFDRSTLHSFGTLAFHPSLTFNANDDLGAGRSAKDQILSLTQVKDTSDLYYVMTGSSASLRFYPSGRASDIAACKDALAARRIDAENLCGPAREARSRINRPFCAAFAQMTTAWLGLSDSNQESRKCGIDLTNDAKAAKPTDPSTFVKASSASADDYLANAQLSENDLMKLLTPACPVVAPFNK